MSRFWAAAASSSEGERESDDDSSVEPQNIRQAGGKFGATFAESDSDSEDEVRVVKSQKDRAWDSMREGIAKIKNARKNSDWPQIQDEFENVNKMIDKSKMLIMKDGLPNFYIVMLSEVEEHVQTALKDKEAIKKMKPVVSRALNQMKLKVRKHNEKYRVNIDDFHANPEKYAELEEDDESDDDDSSSDSDEDSASESDNGSEDSSGEESSDDEKPTKAAATKKAVKAADDSDADSLSAFDDDEDDDESTEDEEDGRKELKGRARWLKKAPTASDVKKPAKKATSAVQQEASRKKKKDFTETAVTSKRPLYAALDEELSEELLEKRVMELMASRGRKNTDPREILRQLEMLSRASKRHGPRLEIPVSMHLISAMFDNRRLIDDYMEHDQWRTCFRLLSRITALLEANPELFLGTLLNDDAVAAVAALPEDANEEEGEEESKGPEKQNSIRVVGSLETFLLRLEEEYTKSLQQINPHTKEYILRLSDEASLKELAESVLKYYQHINNQRAAATISLMIVEHIYYKHDSVTAAVHKSHNFTKVWGKHGDLHPASLGGATAAAAVGAGATDCTKTHPASALGNPVVTPEPYDPSKQLEELVNLIYKHGDERCKTRALLCSVHHHALHDRFYLARDLMMISHIQDFVDKADVKTQILYNRAVVTLGLCAFRLGLLQKAHELLTGICSGRVKELLAQGQMKWADKDPEQEKVERRRQMPYHMHINPDLLECCHLTSAMILELPYLARGGALTPQNAISKQFRKYLGGYNKQLFTGPPENTREHVLAATKALLAGEWRKAVDYLMKLEVWNLIPNDGGEAVKTMLRARIQEEAVRTFLAINGNHYDSLRLGYLCDMFEMKQAHVRRIICRMIFQRELSAAWDIPSDILVMYKTENSPLQALAQTVVEKVVHLADSNERVLDPLAGVYGFKDDWTSRDGRKQWGGNQGQGQQGDDRNRQRGGGRGGSGGWKPQPGGGMRSGGSSGGRGGGGGRGYRSDRTGGASSGGGRVGGSSSTGQGQQRNAWGNNQGGSRYSDAGTQQGSSQSQSRSWGSAPN